MIDEPERRTAPLEKADIFRGLDIDALNRILDEMEPRHFEAGDVICREGEPGTSLFLVSKGLLEVILRRMESVISVALLREGDIVGELSVLVGEPRSADVIARTPTDILELGEDRYQSLLSLYPRISVNLNQVLIQRLRQSNLKLAQTRLHSETAVILVKDRETTGLALDVVEAVKTASVRGVGVILCHPMVAGGAGVELPDVESTLARRDRLAKSYGLIIIVARTDQPHVRLLLDIADRCLVLASPETAGVLASVFSNYRTMELCLTRPSHHDEWGELRVIRTLNPYTRSADVSWLGRHIARTKLGLVLGAGGARGYAHVGVLEVLEQEGLRIDYVGGSSIGALVGYFVACGMRASEINAALRDIFNPNNVREMLRTSIDGSSVGLDYVLKDLKKWTRNGSFADLATPLTVMTADLNAKKAVAIKEGPMYDAVYAAMAVPGLVPPYERGAELLVDALSLVPVPVTAVKDGGADITVAVNLLSRDTLESWPNGSAAARTRRRRRMRMIDTLMESLDMLQLDTSIRNASEADIVITPRFGPSTWRDYHLADLFYTAGCDMARERMPDLLGLTQPSIQ
jgi:predicted acylesterase/phospholipase RssA/CRP-like cAMP-binding protein